MLCGLLLGFFLGVLCLFWVKESVFTRRHQMGNYLRIFLLFLIPTNMYVTIGIVAGMLINVSCGVIVYY